MAHQKHVFGLVAGLLVLINTCSVYAASPIPECAEWTSIPLNKDTIQVEYDGYGRVEFLTDGTLRLKPKTSTAADETHAALALVKAPAGTSRYAYRVTYENTRALRAPASNPWEVFWLFYDYKPTQDGKKNTNYFIFKPNGVETGTASAEIAQQFLQTANSPKSVVGQSYELTLVRDQNRAVVSVDGAVVSDLKSAKLNKSTLDGQLGLYTEDGDVLVKNVQFCAQFIK